MEEQWKLVGKSDVASYWVSNLGNVKSVVRGITRYPRKILDNGYLKIQISDHDGRSKRKLIHRLVAENFVNNPYPLIYRFVNHKDLNKTNNRFDNLEWCTTMMNIHHYRKTRGLSYKKEFI